MTTKKKTTKKTATKKNKCEALKFPAATKIAVILVTLCDVWKKRNVDLTTGKLKNNNYAPIWFYHGDVRKMACRGTADDSSKLMVWKVETSAALPQPKITWG